METRLARLVAEHNRMQPRPRKRHGLKTVVVVRDGTYNDGLGKARRLKAGDVLETRAVYAAALVESGFAEWLKNREEGGNEL